MPMHLRKLRINRVDLVDRGANPDAHVVLFKREPNPNDPPPKETLMDSLNKIRTILKNEPTTQKFIEALAALDTEVEKAEEKPDTFDDVMARRNLHKVMNRLNEFQMGLFETIERISMSDAAEKTKLVKSAIKAFVQRVGTELPQFIDETMRKDDRRDKIQTLLADTIREGEGTMTEPANKKTDTPKADIGALRKMFAGMAKLWGATPEEVSAIDPEVSDADVWKGVSPQLRARIEASEAKTGDEVKKREEAEKRVAKLEQEKSLASVREEMKNYTNMGIDPTKDAVLFQEMTKGLNEEQVKRVREIFTSAHETIGTGKAFAELGSRGAGVPADSVEAEVAKQVTAMKAKPEHKDLTEDDAMAAIFAADPDLYEKYRKEVSVRV